MTSAGRENGTEGEGYREVFGSCNAVVHKKRKDSITHKGLYMNFHCLFSIFLNKCNKIFH